MGNGTAKMRIIGREKIDEFIKRHQQAEGPFNRWLLNAKDSSWNNFHELKQTFGTADYYNGAVIFNIGGNKFRLITKVIYESHKITIDYVLTHEEYDQNKWKKNYEGT